MASGLSHASIFFFAIGIFFLIRPVQYLQMCYINIIYIFCFFRENQPQSMYGNIMYDRRIVRGNTYAQNVLPVVIIFLHF